MAEDTFKQIVEVEVKNDDAIQAVVEQQKAIDGLKSTISDLKKQQKELDTTTKEGAKAYEENAKMIVVNEAQLKTLNQTMNANKRIVEANNAGTNEQTGAYQRLSQQYAALAQEAKDMAVVYGVNSEESIKASQEAKTLSDKLKEIDASVGQNQRNVGNYSGAIEASAKSILGMKQKLEMLKADLEKMDINSSEFEETKKTIDSLSLAVDQAAGKVDEFGNREPKNMAKKNFEDTLITVGILSGSIGALSEAFGENENVQDALVKTQKALVISQTLANVVKEKGAIIDTIQLVKDKALVASKLLLSNTMRIFGLTSAQAWTMATLGVSAVITGVVLLIGKFDKIVSGLKSFFGIADKFKDTRKDIDSMTQSMDNYAEKTKLVEDRMKAQGKSEQELLNYRKKRYEEQLKAEREIYTSISKLGKNATDEEKERLKESTEFIKNSGLERFKMETEQIALTNKEKQKADDDAKRKRENSEAEAKKRREANAEAEKQKTIKEHDKKLSEMELKQKMYNAQNRELTAETAKANFDFEKSQLDKKLEYGKITQEEYNLLLLESQNKYQDATLKIVEAGIEKEKELAEKSKNQETIDFSNKLEIAKGNLDLEFQLKAEQREKQRQAEIADAEKLNNDLLQLNEQKRLLEIQKAEGDELQILAINQKYAEIKKQNAESNANSEFLINEKYRQAEIQAENAKNDAKISMYSQAFGALATIAGENTQLSKGFASAQIAIDTYKGAMSAFANAGNPYLGAILAAAVVVKGAKAIKDVWKVKNGQKSVSGGGGGGGNVNVSQGMAQRNAREMPSEAIQRTQKTEPTIVPVLVTNNLTEKIDTKVQVTNNASM